MLKSALKSFTIALSLVGGSAFAGGITTVTVHFGPQGASPVPAMSAPMLLVLGLLLAVISYRVFKDTNFSKFTSFFIIGAAVATSGIGSFQLISDAKATGTQIALGETFKTSGNLGNNGTFFLNNESGINLLITDIELSNIAECSVAPGSTCEVGGVILAGNRPVNQCEVTVLCVDD